VTLDCGLRADFRLAVLLNDVWSSAPGITSTDHQTAVFNSFGRSSSLPLDISSVLRACGEVQLFGFDIQSLRVQIITSSLERFDADKP
jgi:hypothetical protein